jgi:hypothetical protein
MKRPATRAGRLASEALSQPHPRYSAPFSKPSASLAFPVQREDPIASPQTVEVYRRAKGRILEYRRV